MFKKPQKEDKFFELFDKVAETSLKAATMLDELLNDLSHSEEKLKELKDVEHEGDNLQHQILEQLNQTFLTPFDREDIHTLITSIDNVADYLHGASSRMRLYQVDKITKSIRKMTEINLEACQNIDSAVKELRNLQNFKVIKDACARINKLENKSDNVYNKAVFEIFENETDAKNIIKYKNLE